MALAKTDKKIWLFLMLAVGIECLFQTLIDNILYTGILFAICFIGFILYLKFVLEQENKKIISFTCSLLYLVIYVCIRLTTAAMKEPLIHEFSLNSTQWSSFSSIFSLGYGAAQFATGYVLSKAGLKGIAVFATLTGIFTFLLSIQPSYSMCLILRGIIGVGCSAGIIGFCSYLSAVWPSRYFSGLLNVGLFMGLKFATIVNFFCSKMMSSGTVTWRSLNKILGISGIASGVLMYLSFCGLKNKDESEDQQSNTQQTSQNNLTIKDYIFSFEVIAMCLISWGCTAIMYGLQTGFLDTAFSFIPFGYATYVLNSAQGFTALLLPFFVLLIGAEFSLVLLIGLQVLGILLITLFSTNYWIVLISLSFISMGGTSHSICPMIIGERYQSNVAPVLFGVLNFFAMLFGCSLSQQLFGMLIDYSANGSKIVTKDLLFSIKFLSGLSVISFVLSIALFLKRKRVQYEVS
jgi:MFS family permease